MATCTLGEEASGGPCRRPPKPSLFPESYTILIIRNPKTVKLITMVPKLSGRLWQGFETAFGGFQTGGHACARLGDGFEIVSTVLGIPRVPLRDL